MLGKIFQTVLSRGFTLAAGFIMVFLTAGLLGAEIRGEISLLTFALAIIAALTGIIGGPVMVYQASRVSSPRVILFTITWSLLVCAIVPPVLVLIQLLPAGLLHHTIILGFLLSLFSGYAGISLGMQKLKTHNFINLLQALLLPVSFLFFYGILNIKSLDSFLYSLYFSYGIPAFISIFGMAGLVKKKTVHASGPGFSGIFRQGAQIQLATLLQLISYRAGFYFLELYRGHDEVGIFSVAIAFAEASWIISKSLSTIQYGEISASRDENFNRRITNYFLKISSAGTFIACIILLLLPASLFSRILGDEFSIVSSIIPFLVPGILLMSASTIFAHYFSGKAKNAINTTASGMGALTAIILGFLLVPNHGVTGAAIATAGGYLAGFSWLTFRYYKMAKSGIPGND